MASTGLGSSFTCSCTSSTIQVNNGFESAAFAAGGTISFDVQGVRNPISTEPSGSFTFLTRTSASYSIEQITSGVTVTMTSTTALQLVSISSTSLINGASNNLTFTVNSPSDLVNGNKLSIVFPTQITLPTTVVCVGVTNLAASLTCSKSSQTVDVTLTFSPSTTLAAGTSFSLTIQSITNPTSTQPTDNFGVSIKNTNGYLINNYSTDLKLSTTTAAAFTSASLTQGTLDASAIGDVTFNLQLAHAVPSGGMLVAYYPSEVSVDSSTLAAELVSPTAIASLTLQLTSSERKIQITNMFPSGGTAGTTYQFKIKNIKNTATAATTTSFEFTTFVSSLGLYRINNVKTGLTMTANCNYPCKTCESTNKSTCNSCLIVTPALYLQSNACVTVCDEGKYPLNGVCENCNSTCVACATTNKDTCTKCGHTGFEYLSGTTCVGTCPDGTFGNTVSNTCDSCDSTTAKCQTCSGISTNCLSCVTSPNKFILYGTSCVSTCPSGESVYDSTTDECVS